MTIPDFGPVLTGGGGGAGPLDQIRLIGVTARGRHGVLADERRDGQDFTVDAVLHVDTSRAAATDDLAETVDYGALAVRIADVVRGEPVDLIETLAARIAESCLASPDSAGVVAVDVAVHKPQAPITEPFTDVVIAIRRNRADLHPEPGGPDSQGLDERPAEPVTAVLALGTNLGEREATLRAALAGLGELADLVVEAVSPVGETDPVGGPDQPDYLNAVVLVRTLLSPRELLAACQRIEAGQGRERAVRWGPRTLDVDVIRYGDLLSADPGLELPHPRAGRRAFVLAPWLAVDPQAWLPTPSGRRPVAPLLAVAPDRDGVRARPDLRLEEAGRG
jgi:dihydroneopterin aldolase / 2-amino-4-hydroxy-6-hydroxymethyldihydropteridine diphosphokinase